MLIVLVLGFVLEATGLGVTAWGLRTTWSVHAHGRPFMPARLRAAWRWVRRVILRRDEPVIKAAMGAAIASATASASAYGRQPLSDSMTPDEKFAVLERQLEDTMSRVAKAEQAIRNETAGRTADVKRLDDALGAQRTQLEQRDSEFAVDGIPVAVLGLVMAVAGLVLQFVASVATFPS